MQRDPNMSEINTFEDLEVWKRGCQLAVDVCVATADSKDYALKDQMQRSAISIPSNIAEGCERDSTSDFIRFLRYSKGSTAELRTQLYISERVRQRIGIPPMEGSKTMITETKELARMLQSLINSLKRRLKSSSTDH
jgi:four helix bundle protein